MGIFLNSPCDSIGKDASENAYFMRLPKNLSEPLSEQAVKSLIKGNYSPLCFEDLCIEFSAESLYGMYSSFFPYSSPPFAKDFSLRDGLLEVV